MRVIFDAAPDLVWMKDLEHVESGGVAKHVAEGSDIPHQARLIFTWPDHWISGWICFGQIC